MGSSREPTRLTRLLLLFFFFASIFAQTIITTTPAGTPSTSTAPSTPTPTPDAPAPPAGLGIKQDRSALAQKRSVWSAKLRYDSAVADLFSNDDLYALAKQAWDEMQADIEPRRVKNGRQDANTITKKDDPGMMGLIAVGNTIYFSSSMKGGKFIYGYTLPNGQPGEVTLALDRCQMALRTQVGEDTKPFHVNKASCAEILALHQYYLDPAVSDADKETLPAGMRAAAYGDGGNKKNPDAARPYEPCGNKADDKTTWGCAEFLDSMAIVAPPLPRGTLSNPTPRPVEITYVPVCES
ncbi:hypothetical protein FB567DRAFT_266432 [Paraphoma chrysanthemicola]|uniref:Uncharacterized protein n=1 Tax=Paraphoma chrysanthemicola TaxID=798071 RepID=A0A8K0W1E1_9PLEO|nr:hypothetical protein FB567DRAFT_266432 [Paraphoma chrysanthemicola]